MKTHPKIVTFFLVVIGALFASNYLISLNVRQAKIVSVAGSAIVTRAHTGEQVDAKADLRLYQGDTVTTKSKTKVVIQLDDGSITQMTSLSSMKIDQLSKSLKGQSTNLALDDGKSWQKVKKLDVQHDKFNVSTPTAVAGVRGTYFSSEVEQATDSTFDVFDGQVDVYQKADPSMAVSVRANHRTEVKKTALPTQPSMIPQDDLKKGLSEGIEGAVDPESSNYDLKINIEPQTLQAGQKGVVTLQFTKGGSPYNGIVTFNVSLSGTATFVENGSQSLDITSNEKGFAKAEITASAKEEIKISADVSFESQE